MSNVIFLPFVAFGAGILSFLSPCILPLLPLYIGYFSTDGEMKEVTLLSRILKTLCFVLGVSVVFFSLGTAAGFLGSFFSGPLFTLFCGLFIIFMGLFQTGFIKIAALERTVKISSNNKKGYVGSFLLGFFFSFGWTPCVGAILSTILSISLEGKSALFGGFLLLIYSLGLAVPFIIIAIFSHLLLKNVKRIYPYLGKIKIAGGILIIAIGIWMIAGAVPLLARANNTEVFNMSANTLSGEEVTLSDFEGKTVYLKFWATWCPVCLSGLREFDALYNEYKDSEDIIIYSVVAPGFYGEMSKEDFVTWAKGQNITFPVLFDEDGTLGRKYQIRAYPTSVFLNEEGETSLIRVGHLNNDLIKSILES